MSYIPRFFLFLVASCTSRFASAITDDGISEESGPVESGNPLMGFSQVSEECHKLMTWLKTQRRTSWCSNHNYNYCVQFFISENILL